MHESPRIRRLRSDLRALEQLRDQSTVIDFTVPQTVHHGLPETYLVRFLGRGLWRPVNTDKVVIRDDHEVSIELNADYPRLMPSLSWRTPIFHPNISGNGVVCLGGYSTHWSPSLSLDELCAMLWDMVRYKNFDVESPYNREAASWAESQEAYRLPLDRRPIRDRLTGTLPRTEAPRKPPVMGPPRAAESQGSLSGRCAAGDAEVVDAEVIEPQGPDILFIE